ncbi:MAG: TrkA C-terminal domain-containing protein [Tissierellia bacterium]|nr:TrkA C-terminal domain-containing protein [Tissierellia bacterium]
MKLAIVGMNSLVEKIVQDFSKQKDEISIFYRDRQVLPSLYALDRVSFYEIENWEEDFLSHPALEAAEGVFLFSDSDAINLFLARLLQKKDHVYAFIRDHQLSKLARGHEDALDKTQLLNGTELVGRSVTKLFYEDEGIPTEVFDPYNLSFSYYPLRPNQDFAGKALKDMKGLEDFLIVSVQRKGDFFIPHGDTVLKAGDRLSIVASTTATQQFRRRYGKAKFFKAIRNRHFVIFGTSPYALAIAREFLDKGADVTLCGRDKADLINISLELPDLKLVYGDGRDRHFQEELGIAHVDGVIAASEDEGQNILVSLVSRELGQDKLVVIYYTSNLARAIYRQDFLAVYNPYFILAQKLKLDLFGPQDLSFFLLRGDIQAYDILIKEDTEAVGQRIADLDLPKGFLLAGILREDGRSLIVKGHTRLFKGDRILAFTYRDQEEALKKFISVDPGRSLYSEILNLF